VDVGLNNEIRVMSSSSGEEIPVEQVTQETREQRLVSRFDFWTGQSGPQKGVAILRFLGFGVVRLIGIDPAQARVGDITVEIAHSGFHTYARVWLKVGDGARGWVWTSELQTSFYFTSYLA
jgi:hypothetical protein